MAKLAKRIPAYKNQALFNRFSDYARASIEDFQISMKKPFIKPNMRVWAQASKDNKGKTKFCELCLAGGTFGVNAKEPGDAAKEYDIEIDRNSAAEHRMSAVNQLREGNILLALTYFYVNAKRLDTATVDHVCMVRRAKLNQLKSKIRKNYSKRLNRAPLKIYFEVIDEMAALGL